MSKRKNQDFEMDDEFWAQLDFLRMDYDHAIQTIEQQKQDIQKLLSLLVERAIPIPCELIDDTLSENQQTIQTNQRSFLSTDFDCKKWLELTSHQKNLKNLHTLLDRPKKQSQ